MLVQDQLRGIRQARRAVARSLVAALSTLDEGWSEMQLSQAWMLQLRTEETILPFGWYQPPPFGMSVLIGNPESYERLTYQSLRHRENFPANYFFGADSVVYPYFSAVDKTTLMIGDQVGTYYKGSDPSIKCWLKESYKATKEICMSVKEGMLYREFFFIVNDIVSKLGAKNNTFSISGGLASDIGHIVPFFADDPIKFNWHEKSQEDVCRYISDARIFIGPNNRDRISKNCAFTIEPQMIVDGMPMASFHMIIAIVDGDIFIIEEFQEIFEYFGMDLWIYKK